MDQQFSIGIWNDRLRAHVVWIEPWAEHYTLLPNQKLLVTTSGSVSGSGPWFILVETEGNTQVYVERGAVERDSYPLVQIDGVEVVGGHNRQAAIDAGIWK